MKGVIILAILGNPYVANVPSQMMSAGELAQAIRVDIAGELEAIIGYEAHVMSTTDDRAKKILKHIADEERQHVGELQQLLYILSPNDMEKTEKGRQEIVKQQQQNFQPAMT
jgi:rubrerythrin